MSRSSYRRIVLVGAALAVAATSAACHGASGDKGGTALGGALTSVADTDVTRAYFEWADLARIRDLAGISQQRPTGSSDADHRRWSTLFGTGTGRLGVAAVRLAGTVDLFTARSALQIGTPPRTAVRVDGVDTGVARAGLTRLGGKPGQVAGHDGVVLGADNSIDVSGPAAELGVLNAFNKTAFDGDHIAFGPAEPQVADALTAGDHPLIADPTVVAAAACLGDVLTATIAPATTAKVAGAQTIAIGVRDPTGSTDPATEELCLTGPDKAAADALEQRVRQHATTSAVLAATNQPWSALASTITVSRPNDRTVRIDVTDKPDRPAGVLLQALSNQDLAGLTG